MSKRDKQIIADLERFRCMSRNDIIDLYFSHLKNPVTNANTVLKRLVRDKQIEVSRSFSPFVYFPAGSIVKRNSTKIPHFLKIVEVHKPIKHYYTPHDFIVEPKFDKGLAEPDALTVIKGTPFFIEVQRNLYSQKVMDQKIKRYEALKYSDEFNEAKFPFVIMVTDSRYEINSDAITVFQVASIDEFMNNLKGSIGEQHKKNYFASKQEVNKQSGIKFKIG